MKEVASDAFNVALSRAMFYCSTTERCPADLFKKFSQWEVADELWDSLLEQLENENFVSTERYAIAFARDKIRFNKWGFQKVVFHLRAKGITNEIISSLFDSIDFEEYLGIIKSEIIKKSKSLRDQEDFQRKAKLLNFATSRGYELDYVYSILNTLFELDDNS